MPIRPLFQEILVNNVLQAGNQEEADVAALGGSIFVGFVWQSAGGDAGGTSIRGRVIPVSDITPTSNEFLVNSDTGFQAGNQGLPTLIGLSPSRMLAVWRSSAPSGDGDGSSIRGRVLDAAGNPVGNEFQVNFTAAGTQDRPAAAVLANGSFVIAWRSDGAGGDGTGLGIRARIFNANGTPNLSANGGSDFLVNLTTQGAQHFPSVAALDNGRSVVAYRSAAGDGSGTGILARLVGADGVPAGEFLVNTTLTGNQNDPKVARLADGRFVVVWQSNEPGDGAGSNIRARIFMADGTPAGGSSPAGADFIVNENFQGDQQIPDVTARPNGEFVVVWQSHDGQGLDKSGSGIRSRMFDPREFFGAAGNDFWHGGSLSDRISGLGGNDTLFGNGGDDILNGGPGNDTLHGGEGANDRAVYSGAWRDYRVTQSGSTFTVVDRRPGSPEGTDTLTGIEQLIFSNRTVAIADAPVARAMPDRTLPEGSSFSLDASAFFSDADLPLGDALTYALSGAPPWLSVDAATGLISGTPGFTDAGTAKINVTATDAHGAAASSGFMLIVQDVNGPPTSLSLSNASVAENSPAGTVIGKLTATDPDPGDVFTFSIVADRDNKFKVAGDELQVAGSLDFESQRSHTITVRVEDKAGLRFDRNVTISVTDVDEGAPKIAVSGKGLNIADGDASPRLPTARISARCAGAASRSRRPSSWPTPARPRCKPAC